MAGTVASTELRAADRIRNWKNALLTMSTDGEPDAVSRWLIMTRAAVIPMTLTSGLIGGLLAIGAPDASLLYFLLCLLGLGFAHATNNLINDYFDLESGVDASNSPRALYAPHPVLSGWISRRGLLGVIIALNLADAAIAAALFVARGWPVIAFAAAGLFISVFYVAPPLRLKHRGLGEPGVFIVWGPLMVCGTYFVTTGQLPAWVWAASIPYAILVTTVLIGKHIDKLPYDAPKHVHTLPVLLGEENSLRANRYLMISFYAAVAVLVLTGVLGWWTLVVFASIPVLRRSLALYSHPKPAAPPARYTIWPLWYAPSAFVLARRAGGLFVLGLLLSAVLPAL